MALTAESTKESIMYCKQCNCTSCRSTTAGGFEVMEFGVAQEGPFNEAQEMELALELMSVTSEAELDQFLGGLFKGALKGLKKVGSAIGKVAKPLGGALKGIAKKALPFVGGALGSFIPIPGVGTAIGSALGGAVAKALELEFSGMEYEQQEFEMARRFVRIAGTAAQLAASSDGSPQAVRKALGEALVQHVPHYELAGEEEGEAYGGRWRKRRAQRGYGYGGGYGTPYNGGDGW
ncbi:hypothetical protein ASD15_13030 [Massilia sp. Root351]|nr:hypothetical protein ASD15_13030 [Massilia sp. Root351]